MRQILIITALMLAMPVFAEQQLKEVLAVSEIPDSLKQDAYSVVQSEETNVIVNANSEVHEYYKRVITIIDKNGEHDAFLVISLDPTITMKNFKGKIYDAQGNLVKEISKSDLRRTEYSRYLYTDDYQYLYNPTHAIPFTVSYQWETERKKDVISYPMFQPIETRNQSLISGKYSLFIPVGMEFDYMVANCRTDIEKMEVDGELRFGISVNNHKAISRTYASKPLGMLLPNVRFKPTKFNAGGIDGDASSWQGIGQWLTTLMSGRDEFTADQISIYKSLTDTCTSDVSKAKVLYNHLRNTTRYVNISLGIGGLRPECAKDVATRGFGDCKGLSNYMHSMLKAVGVKSVYAGIKLGDKTFFPDYPSIGQFNHAILCVPTETDTVWLECTAPSLPFGYIHTGIAGHNALLVEGENSRIVRLPEIPDSTDFRQIKCKITLQSNAAAEINVEEINLQSYYQSARRYEDMPVSDFQNAVREETSLSRAAVSEFDYKETFGKPESILTYSFYVPKLGTRMSKRILLPLDMYASQWKVPVKMSGNLELELDHEKEIRETVIVLPEGYTMPNKPADMALKNEFGEFSQTVVGEDGEVIIKTKIEIYGGIYSAEKRAEYEKFRISISKRLSEKFVLTTN